MTDDPLAGLRAWHPPDPISWWPPAPGWWFLGGLVCVLLALTGLWWWRRWRRGAPMREALRQLDGLESDLAADGDHRRYLATVSRLLRRLALVRFHREQVAGLTGRAWLEFLDATGGGGGFTQGVGRVLAEGAYRANLPPGDDPDPARLGALVRSWIRSNARGGRRLVRHQARTADDGKARPSPRPSPSRGEGDVAPPRREIHGKACVVLPARMPFGRRHTP